MGEPPMVAPVAPMAATREPSPAARTKRLNIRSTFKFGVDPDGAARRRMLTMTGGDWTEEMKTFSKLRGGGGWTWSEESRVRTFVTAVRKDDGLKVATSTPRVMVMGTVEAEGRGGQNDRWERTRKEEGPTPTATEGTLAAMEGRVKVACAGAPVNDAGASALPPT
jgi:hypothetical protein